MIRHYRDIVRVRYNGGPPALVAPLKLHLKEGAYPVCSKCRRYPSFKRQFSRNYVAQLQNLKLVKSATCTGWVSAPLFVPKKPPKMYRMTVYYRPITSATFRNTRPVQHMDAALQEVRGSEAFARIEFALGYWQLQMDPESQPLHAFMTPDGAMHSTRTKEGRCSRIANFQACVESCTNELFDNLLTWLDDFSLHNKAEGGLLRVAENFLAICHE